MNAELARLISRLEAGAIAEIIRIQTTYLDIVCAQPETSLPGDIHRIRIHFRGKRESSVKREAFNSLTLLDQHPLLLEYIEPHQDVYLSSVVPDKQKFISNLEEAARLKFGDWRPLDRYVNSMGLNKFLDKSYGLLMSAPSSFVEMVVNVAKRNGVELNVLSGIEKRGSPQVLLLDKHYVVADSFRAEVSGAE